MTTPAVPELVDGSSPALGPLPELGPLSEPVEGPTTAAHEIHLVAHGSPDPRHAASVLTIASTLARRSGASVTWSFLEHNQPRAVDALAPGPPAAPPDGEHVSVVVPLLLTAGVHWHRDLPPVVGQTGRRSILLAPPSFTQFARAVQVQIAIAAEAPIATVRPLRKVVLASAGSTRPQVRSRLQALADRVSDGLARTHPNAWVVIAERPDDVPQLAGPGDVVVPLLVADGIFADRIRVAATQRGARVTRILGETDEFAAGLLDLVEKAAARTPLGVLELAPP